MSIETTPVLVLLGHFQNEHVEDKTYILLEHDVLNSKITYAEQAESLSYYIDQHTCPTNWLGVFGIATVENKTTNTDPHGVFHYVSHALYTDECEFRSGVTIGELVATYDDGTNRVHEELLQHLLSVMEKQDAQKGEDEW
jgi:hypothetical protein